MAKKSNYAKRPKPDSDVSRRLYWMLATMTGVADKTQAAKELRLSRTQFHNLFNQTLDAMTSALTPKPGGRPSRTPLEKELLEENERLRRTNDRLQQRVDTVDRLLGVASEMMQGRIQPARRAKRKKATAKAASDAEQNPDAEEPDEALQLLEGALAMRALGLTAPLAAAIIGVSPQTVARWKHNLDQGLPLRRHRTPGPAPRWSAEAEQGAVALMRELRGLVGAEALSKKVPGLSRRSAARVKRATLTEMERELKQRCERVVVTTPGVIRGFDAMYLGAPDASHALVAADAAVPFRTTIARVAAYDGPSVAKTLERDIADHGAPLAYRLDRASSHRTDEVENLLRAHDILRLHGPPRHPEFYGQTERQMREHRDWLGHSECLDDEELERMRRALNGARPRPTLGFRTAEEVWNERPKLCEDRDRLRDEVAERAARLLVELDPSSVRGPVADFAQRLAIQQALANRGYLRFEIGGWC